MHRSALHILLLAFFLCAGLAQAQFVAPFPGVPPTKSSLKAQEKSDQLYKKGNFDRALVIYRDDLAPSGDKFAQYMVGYMYLAGQAVDQDPIRATAWYRLAAERGEESFVYARDTLMEQMNAAQRTLCDEIYTELRTEMGDIVIVSDLIKDDLQELAPFIRSDLAIDPNLMQRSQHDRHEKLLKQVRFNLDTRMIYLLDISNVDDSITQEEREKISRLYQTVQRDLLSLDAVLFGQ